MAGDNSPDSNGDQKKPKKQISKKMKKEEQQQDDTRKSPARRIPSGFDSDVFKQVEYVTENAAQRIAEIQVPGGSKSGEDGRHDLAEFVDQRTSTSMLHADASGAELRLDASTSQIGSSSCHASGAGHREHSNMSSTKSHEYGSSNGGRAPPNDDKSPKKQIKRSSSKASRQEAQIENGGVNNKVASSEVGPNDKTVSELAGANISLAKSAANSNASTRSGSKGKYLQDGIYSKASTSPRSDQTIIGLVGANISIYSGGSSTGLSSSKSITPCDYQQSQRPEAPSANIAPKGSSKGSSAKHEENMEQSSESSSSTDHTTVEPERYKHPQRCHQSPSLRRPPSKSVGIGKRASQMSAKVYKTTRRSASGNKCSSTSGPLRSNGANHQPQRRQSADSRRVCRGNKQETSNQREATSLKQRRTRSSRKTKKKGSQGDGQGQGQGGWCCCC